MIKERISLLRERIEKAALRSGRKAKEIKIVCVTKNAEPCQIKEVIECGLSDLGENKLQPALEKIEALKDLPVHWHMVGHLQSNKVRKAVENFELIHSVDSQKLVSLINKEASKIGKIQKVLLQVNTQAEDRFGLREEDLTNLIKNTRGLEFVDICGLMTMAPFFEDAEMSRPFFRKLRELKERIEKEHKLGLPILSMGMSQDFEVAIEEGANMIRIGTAIFKD